MFSFAIKAQVVTEQVYVYSNNKVVFTRSQTAVDSVALEDGHTKVAFFDTAGNRLFTATMEEVDSIRFQSSSPESDIEKEARLLSLCPVADILDVKFNADGTATDVSPMQNAIATVGSPSTFLKESAEGHAASFDNSWAGTGTDYYRVDYASNTALIKALSDGHTMEAVVKANYSGTIANKEAKFFSSHQAGGTGFLICKKTNGKNGQNEITFLPNVSTNGKSTWKWATSGVVPVSGQYYHVVGVWNKTEGKAYIYVDGELKNTVSASGSLNFPTTGCNWFGIGADPYSATESHSAWNGDVVMARIYDAPLDGSQVKARWEYLSFLKEKNEKMQESNPIFQQITDNIAKQNLAGTNPASLVATTNTYYTLLNEDGSFKDIDYDSHEQTVWTPRDHCLRLTNMVLAYIHPESTLNGDDELYDRIVKSFDYWTAKKPTSTNWWFGEIGWSQPMGLNMCLMRKGKKQLPQNTIKALSAWMQEQGGPTKRTGANKMDVALQWMYRSVAEEDKDNLNFSVNQFFLPMSLTTGDGIQHDYSYLIHGPQLYTGAYGGTVLTAYFQMAFYLTGTEYDSDATTGVMRDFLLKSVVPAMRGPYMQYNVGGRGFLGRISATYQGGIANVLTLMKQLDPSYSEEYDIAIARIQGTQPVSFGVKPWHQHYWRADYSLHLRPEYTIDVRMASTRTYRCENGNDENNRGYFITEGGTQIVQRGDEYFNISPVWDWSRIPGTTTPAVSTVPVPAAWGQYGQSTFAGGVSDGTYGCTVYNMVDKNFGINSSGKKAYFFFDKEVVCMGTDIVSTNAASVNTTLNQCLLNGTVTAEDADGNAAELAKGEHPYTNLRWVNHDNISYYLPEDASTVVRNDVQSGNWNYISGAIEDKTEITRDVFKFYFDHGVKPTAGQYIYYIVPATASIAEAKVALDELEIMNTSEIQAVYNKTAAILQIIFQKAGTYKLDETITVETDKPCAVMLTGIGTPDVKISVADPSYTLGSLHLNISHLGKEAQGIDVNFRTSVAYRGSTASYSLPTE